MNASMDVTAHRHPLIVIAEPLDSTANTVRKHGTTFTVTDVHVHLLVFFSSFSGANGDGHREIFLTLSPSCI